MGDVSANGDSSNQVKEDQSSYYNSLDLSGFNLLPLTKNFSTVTSCKISLASVVAPIFK